MNSSREMCSGPIHKQASRLTPFFFHRLYRPPLEFWRQVKLIIFQVGLEFLKIPNFDVEWNWFILSRQVGGKLALVIIGKISTYVVSVLGAGRLHRITAEYKRTGIG